MWFSVYFKRTICTRYIFFLTVHLLYFCYISNCLKQLIRRLCSFTFIFNIHVVSFIPIYAVLACTRDIERSAVKVLKLFMPHFSSLLIFVLHP